MKRVGSSSIWAGLWREKGGWAYKIEQRGEKFCQWGSSGFETKKAAEASMDEVLKALKVKE
jgi:hypothetical protein